MITVPANRVRGGDSLHYTRSLRRKSWNAGLEVRSGATAAHVEVLCKIRRENGNVEVWIGYQTDESVTVERRVRK